MTNRLYRLFACAVLLLGLLPLQPVSAQVPLSRQEQVQIYQSLSPSQQQALIRQLQGQLPAGQREAMINALIGQAGQAQPAAGQVPTETDIAALAAQFAASAQATAREEESLGGGDTLVIEFPLRDDAEPVPADEQEERDAFVERLKDGNPYQLDDAGRLYLPGVPPIELAGLDVDQATARLSAERDLRPFAVTVTRLPLAPVGTAALKPFGYDLFRSPTSLFAPTANIPVPVGYVVGPGDTLVVQLRGDPDVNGDYPLTVARDGTISLPELGPLNVSGQSFDDVRSLINNSVTEQMIGVQVTTTLGELRSITVQILGEVARPGVYTVSSLATMTNALYQSGGINEIGSLRRIERKRDGATISTLDVYDLLLRGDTRGDQRLQQGDAIFVPTIGDTVAVDGEVLRPAVYELNGEQTVDDLIDLAGGLRPNANPNFAKLERIVPGRGTTVTDLNLVAATGGQTPLRDGDVLRVEPNLDQLEDAVRLAGNVQRPGLQAWYPGMTVSQLLPSPELVKPMSDVNYVLIRREPRPNVEVEALSVDLEAVWEGRRGAADLALQPRDTVYVFHLETGRQQYVAPIVEELKAQAGPGEPLPVVSIVGEVRAEGEYPLEPGMRVGDLVRAGGGLSDAAYGKEAELTRYSVVDGEYRETDLVNIDLEAVLVGDISANVILSPYDVLSIREITSWQDQESVTLRGEFNFQGTYPIRKGELLTSVIERAGGLTNYAFVEGSVFTRVKAKQREETEKERLAQRIESDLAALDLSEQGASDTQAAGQVLLRQLREIPSVGRQVIHLDQILAGTSPDIVLDDGDVLYVPEFSQEVTVIGEVQYPTSHTYLPGLSRDDYVERSGGLTRKADARKVYIVRANGDVITENRERWFRRGAGGTVMPGDTIVAPIKVDRIRPLQLWGSVAQIVYSMAIAAAAVNSF